MNILHIVEDFSLKSGGLRTVINNLNHQIINKGHKSYILSSEKEEGDDIYLIKAKGKWLYSKKWIQKIKDIVERHKITIIHIHGVWLYPQYIGAKYGIENKIPVVLSPHGMYQPWLWRKGTLKKKIYFYFLVKKWFSKARVIHSITPDETKNLKYFFKSNYIKEIPNLISLKTNVSFSPINKKYFLYLGRLNKTKGIDLLIKSFSQVENDNFILKIAGNFNDYKEELQQIVYSLGLKNKVEFLGQVKGDLKVNLIKNAWVMVSPSFSDVIGMVNLEAASLKTPMITTHNTGLKKDWDSNGGKLINPNIDELTIALKEVLNWSLEERNKNGEQLFDFVKNNYTWESRIRDWELLYKNLNNEK